MTPGTHRDTLRTFLWRFDLKHLHSLKTAHDKLRKELFPRLGLLYSAIVDADTTTLITYGSQESTAWATSPKDAIACPPTLPSSPARAARV